MHLFSQLSRPEASSSTHDESKKSLIYPKNLLIKKDQLEIMKNSLAHNTLLRVRNDSEKTFVASLMIYNHFHWDSEDKIVFLASTKPLLVQQMDACHRIMKIPKSDMIALASRVKPEKRVIGWQECRVIFTTPALFLKALENSIVPTELVKCIVIDEAHKAVGKHAYCKSIRMLHVANPDFRLLALNSNPEVKPNKLPEVMKNLFITHCELRDDSQNPENKRKRNEVDDNDHGTQTKKVKIQEDSDSESEFQPMKILKVEYNILARRMGIDGERRESAKNNDEKRGKETQKKNKETREI